MFVFYRKERPEIFTTRFSSPTSPTDAWRLTSNVIFQAKNVNEKKFSVTHNGRPVQLSCTVAGTSLAFSTVDAPSASSFTIAESEMGELLARKPDTLKYLALAKICRDHATSSRSSPLISGCVVNNFHANTNFPGHKICLDLQSRRPFPNPFTSGQEREHFLVGWVLATDCRTIKYLGSIHENKNVIVNVPGSRIPRPSGNATVLANRAGSRIPQRVGNAGGV